MRFCKMRHIGKLFCQLIILTCGVLIGWKFAPRVRNFAHKQLHAIEVAQLVNDVMTSTNSTRGGGVKLGAINFPHCLWRMQEEHG